MFDILAMDNSSKVVPVQDQPSKMTKTSPTSTVSKAQSDVQNPTLDNIDFLDFVPIENNSNDFDLQDILKTVNEQEEHTDTNNDMAMPIGLTKPQDNV